MDREMMCEIFQKAFTEVTMKLTKISLQGRDGSIPADCKEQMMLCVTGFIEAEIVCVFAAGLCQAIVRAMYGGALPVEEERILYLKEYVNIVCGRAVTVLNNEIGMSSRLSVPYYREEAPKRNKKRQETIKLYFGTDYGDMQIMVDYSVL